MVTSTLLPWGSRTQKTTPEAVLPNQTIPVLSAKDEKVVTAYLKSKQLLYFSFAVQAPSSRQDGSVLRLQTA